MQVGLKWLPELSKKLENLLKKNILATFFFVLNKYKTLIIN